jgi:fucose permease
VNAEHKIFKPKKLTVMTLTIAAFICASIFSALALFEKIKPGRKLSMSTVIGLILCLLVLITGITDIIGKEASSKADKKEILNKIDSVLMKQGKK